MDFDYTDEQRYLRDEARRFLAAHSPPAAARAVLDAGGGYDRALWRRIAEQGWLGITVPEAQGGLGMSHVELAAIAEELGAAIAPVPFGSTLYLFAEAVMTLGTLEQRDTWLPGVVAGETIGCAALYEAPGDLALDRIAARVRGGLLTGTKTPVVDGDVATHAIVLAVDEDGPALFVAALDAVEVTPLEAIDGSVGVARLDFADSPVDRLASIDGRGLLRFMSRAAALAAFEQVGGAGRCLAMATEYVKDRQAFGGPVGRFQAVKHKLADLYVANQLARSHAYQGVWAIDAAPDRLIGAAAAARVAACDAYWLASKEAMHLHGAIGFTWEHDAHLFYRRAHHLSLALGSPTWWKDRLWDTLAAVPPPEEPAPAMAEAVAGQPLPASA